MSMATSDVIGSWEIKLGGSIAVSAPPVAVLLELLTIHFEIRSLWPVHLGGRMEHVR